MMDAHQTLELTPEQDAAGWAILDALNAAKASGNTYAKLEASIALLDWQLSVGLLTRDEFRAMVAPMLLDIIAVADQFPEGRYMLQRVRDEALEALNGDDYAERAAAGLFILSVDGVQNPRRRLASDARNAEAKRQWRIAMEGIRSAELSRMRLPTTEGAE